MSRGRPGAALAALEVFFDRWQAAAATPAGVASLQAAGVPSALLAAVTGICENPGPPPGPLAPPGGLRVVLVCREYPPESGWGGMATFTYELAHGLLEAGHRVAVIAQGGPGRRLDFGGAVEVIRIDPGLRGEPEPLAALLARGVIDLARFMLGYSLAVYRQILVLEAAGGPFDVIDLPEHLAEGVVPALLCGGLKTVRLYTPWSVMAEMREPFAGLDDRVTLRAFEGACLRAADVVTSPSRELAQRVITYFGLPGPVFIVPNPLDPGRFRPVPRPPRDHLVVLFVGRLEHRKGIATLLRAIPDVLAADPRVRFRIVGREPRPTLPAGCFGDGRVERREPVPLAELPAVYQDADISVVPSHYDNSPYSALEAMACGVPVVGTTAGGTAEYVLAGRAGLIVPARDPRALARAVLALAADRERRARMARAGRRRAIARFHYRRVADRMAALYAAARARGLETLRLPAAAPATPGPVPAGGTAIEVLVMAGPGERRALRRTLASLRDRAVFGHVTVVWDGRGRRPPRLAGCRVVPVAGSRAETAARLFASSLAEIVLCLGAGDLALPSLAGGLAWKVLAYAGVGVVACRVRSGGRELSYPAFVARASRGFLFPAELRDAGWPAVLEWLRDRVVSLGWREAPLAMEVVATPRAPLAIRPAAGPPPSPRRLRPDALAVAPGVPASSAGGPAGSRIAPGLRAVLAGQRAGWLRHALGVCLRPLLGASGAGRLLTWMEDGAAAGRRGRLMVLAASPADARPAARAAAREGFEPVVALLEGGPEPADRRPRVETYCLPAMAERPRLTTALLFLANHRGCRGVRITPAAAGAGPGRGGEPGPGGQGPFREVVAYRPSNSAMP